MPTDATLITIGITTRNRPESLQRCLQSLTLLNDVIGEVIVVDDTSDPPIGQSLGPVPGALAAKLRIVEQLKHEGYIVARNTVVRQARFEHVFLLDDDAFVIDADAVRRALALMTQNASVGAVACAQAEADGSPWPPANHGIIPSGSCNATMASAVSTTSLGDNVPGRWGSRWLMRASSRR